MSGAPQAGAPAPPEGVQAGAEAAKEPNEAPAKQSNSVDGHTPVGEPGAQPPPEAGQQAQPGPQPATQPQSGFSAASPISSFSPAYDLGGGTLTPHERAKISDLLAGNRSRRYMQWGAFIGLGSLSGYFLISLAHALHGLFTSKETLAIISTARNWHTLTLLGIAMIVFAMVPLSIVLALVKMIANDNSPKEKEELGLTTPQIELIKVIVEAAKAIKGA